MRVNDIIMIDKNTRTGDLTDPTVPYIHKVPISHMIKHMIMMTDADTYLMSP
jgi:hypothetical protein